MSGMDAQGERLLRKRTVSSSLLSVAFVDVRLFVLTELFGGELRPTYTLLRHSS